MSRVMRPHCDLSIGILNFDPRYGHGKCRGKGSSIGGVSDDDLAKMRRCQDVAWFTCGTQMLGPLSNSLEVELTARRGQEKTRRGQKVQRGQNLSDHT